MTPSKRQVNRKVDEPLRPVDTEPLETTKEVGAVEEQEQEEQGAPVMESPEHPAAPPSAQSAHAGKRTLTDVTAPVTGPRTKELDTGIATALGTRPSAFSPPSTGNTLTAVADATDYGQNSQMADRPNTFDADVNRSQDPSPGY